MPSQQSSDCIMDRRSPVGCGDSLGSCLINTVMLAEVRRGPARGSKLLPAALTITRLLFPLGSTLASLREDMIPQSLQGPVLQKPETRRGQCGAPLQDPALHLCLHLQPHSAQMLAKGLIVILSDISCNTTSVNFFGPSTYILLCMRSYVDTVAVLNKT